LGVFTKPSQCTLAGRSESTFPRDHGFLGDDAINAVHATLPPSTQRVVHPANDPDRFIETLTRRLGLEQKFIQTGFAAPAKQHRLEFCHLGGIAVYLKMGLVAGHRASAISGWVGLPGCGT
jgi:hypothetical protein